jgi:hypothetical protein
MKRIQNMVRTFDIYGDYFSLRIHNQSKFKSLAGGLLSGITLVIMIFCFISFGKDFYLRKNPKMNMELGFYNDSSIPNLNGTEYPNKTIALFYLKIFDAFLKPSLQILNNGSLQSQYLSQCSNEFLTTQITTLTEKDFNENVFYCLQLNNFLLTSGKYSELSLSMNSCNSISDGEIKQNKNLSNCKKSNETITSFTLYFLTEKLGFSPDQRKPFIKKYETTQTIMTNTAYLRINLFLSINDLLDDVGMITDSFEKTKELSLRFLSNIQNLLVPAKYPLLKLFIKISDDYVIYHRFYSKLQDLLASVGGFMKLIITVLNLFNLLIRTYLIDWYIIDNYLSFGDSLSHSKENKKTFTFSNNSTHNHSSNHKSK